MNIRLTPLKTITIISFLSLAFLQLYSCSNSGTNSEKTTTKDSLMERAATIFAPINTIPESADNPSNEAKILLGKTLFYDTRLSKNNTQSCNTCHNLSTFGVDNLATSAGDLGKNGNRNSPTVLNAAYHVSQFWDGRAKDVEEQSGMPILNPVEMNMPHESFVIDKLKSIKGYHQLFINAFPGEENPLHYNNLKKAIGAFERTLITPSKFDKYLQGDAQALSVDEKKGLTAFMDAGCITCHSGVALGGSMMQRFPLFGDNYKTLTGSIAEDKGAMEVSKNEKDKFMFKVPSLRNITKTGPYFHDGSVTTLEKAIHIMGKLQLNQELTEQELKSIITFLHTLTGEVPAAHKSAPAMPE